MLTLSGSVVNIITNTQYDRFEDLEDHIVDYLASVTDLQVFGCAVNLLHARKPTWKTNLEGPAGRPLNSRCLQRLFGSPSFKRDL